MKNFFKTKYRVITDKYCGFECQFRYWWMPFWVQMDGTNTHSTIEAAIQWMSDYKKVVYTSN